MGTNQAVMTLIVVLTITSALTAEYQLHPPDGVSQRRDVISDPHVTSRDATVKRTPGWGKRHDDDSMSAGGSKRRGWGKRDTDNCVYWRSLLQFIEVGIMSARLVPCIL